jgi:hypothetical protein
MPLVLVMTLLPVPETATAAKIDNSGAHVTDIQSLSAADVRDVQVMPSGLVMTLLPVPETATAAKIDNSGAHATENQLLLFALVRVVQVLTAATALARLARVRALSAVMFTPFIFPSAVGTSRDVYFVFAPTYMFFWRVGDMVVMPRAEVMTLLPNPL